MAWRSNNNGDDGLRYRGRGRQVLVTAGHTCQERLEIVGIRTLPITIPWSQLAEQRTYQGQRTHSNNGPLQKPEMNGSLSDEDLVARISVCLGRCLGG